MRKEKGREKERGAGGQRGGRGGPDADVSAITLVATEQQQALPLPFGYWLVTLTTTHVVRAAANGTQVIPLDWWSVFKETALCTLCALFIFFIIVFIDLIQPLLCCFSIKRLRL